MGHWATSSAIFVLVLAMLGRPTPAFAGALLILKGKIVSQNLLAPVIPLPDGHLVSATSVVLAAWRTGFQDDDVLIFNPVSGSVWRYADFAPMPLNTLAETFKSQLFVTDQDARTFTALTAQSLTLAEILAQPGSVVVLDAMVGVLPAGILSLADDDADGIENVADACPSDPAKSQPGVCGCGVTDADCDEDGALDCVDCDPRTAAVHPGAPELCNGIDDDCDGLVDDADPSLEPCDDADLCTQTAVCAAGVCRGTNPIACGPPGTCRELGMCVPATGLCDYPPQADGTPCSDGDPCTQSDGCVSGGCVAGPPRVCPAIDQCHEAGTCDPATGSCSSPAMPDGRPCDDGDPCTLDDSCTDARCIGAHLAAECLVHFSCYRTKTSKGAAPFVPLSGIRLADTLETRTFDLKKLRTLCVATEIIGGDIRRSEGPLAGFQLKGVRGSAKHVKRHNLSIADALGAVVVDTIKPDLLFAASPAMDAQAAVAKIDTFTCYSIKTSQSTPKFPKKLQRTLRDELTDTPIVFDIKKPRHLCVPAAVNDGAAPAQRSPLTCYPIKPARGQPKPSKRVGMEVQTPFGTFVVDTLAADKLCVRSPTLTLPVGEP